MIHRTAFKRLIYVIALATVLGSCSGGSEDKAADPSPSASTEQTSENVDSPKESEELVNGEWVQDLWVYEQILTIDEDGETVDLSDPIVEKLDEPDDSVELPNEAVFHVYESLNPAITDANGEERNDVDTVAGLLEFDGMSALAVLATPEPTATRPIGMTDNVEVDLDHIEDMLTPEMPLVIDFAFMQTRPAKGEPPATGLDLFTRRLTNGQARHLTEQLDGVDQAATYTNMLGATTSMASRMTVGGKGSISDPTFEGMDKGLRKCVRRMGPRCVKSYFDNTVKGAAKSNELIKCNLGGDCEDEDGGGPDPGNEDDSSNDNGAGPTPGGNAPGGGMPGGGSEGNTPGGGPNGEGPGGSAPGGTGNSGGSSNDSESSRPWCGSMCTGTISDPGTVHGDPHLRSFDGRSFDMQGAGEYVLTQGSLMRAHIRTEPISEGNRTVSSVSMIGVEIGGSEIVIEAPDRQVKVRLDGKEIAYDPAEQLVTTVEVDDITLFIEPDSVIISDLTNEIGVVIRNDSNRWLNTSVYIPDSYVELEGLLGDHDGDPDNDLRARDGSILASDASDEDFYSNFANTWRVSQDESLLHYDEGESTETWTNEEFPYFDEPDPTQQQLARGEALCRLAGITEASLLAACAFDFAISNNVGFVRAAQAAETIETRVGIISALADEEASEAVGSNDGGIPESGVEEVHSWAFTPDELEAGTEVIHTCTPDGGFNAVWGGNDGIYTDDSSVCTAAVHAGLLTKEDGGRVVVTVLPGLEDYGKGSRKNGVTTQNWERSWGGSFTLRRE